MLSRPASHVATAYIRRYMIDIDGVPFHDQYALFHPNGLVVVGIAPTHALFHLHDNVSHTQAGDHEQKETETEKEEKLSPSVQVARDESSLPRLILVDYELEGQRKVSKMPTGKRKRGGDVFNEKDVICRIRVAKKVVNSKTVSTPSQTVSAVTGKEQPEECVCVYEPQACVKVKERVSTCYVLTVLTFYDNDAVKSHHTIIAFISVMISFVLTRVMTITFNHYRFHRASFLR